MPTQIHDNIEETSEELGLKRLMDIPIETADSRFLDVREGTLDEHIAMQPSLIAYFGMKRKQADRVLNAIKYKFELWKRELYCSTKSGMQGKPTVDEIKSTIQINNKKEYDDYLEKIDGAQRVFDLYDVYYEALKQKSFSMREFVLMDTEEKSTKESIQRQNDESVMDSFRKNRIREIQSKENNND